MKRLTYEQCENLMFEAYEKAQLFPLYFVATYSKIPTWGVRVDEKGVSYAALHKNASVDYLQCITFEIQDITPKGNIREPWNDEWRKATDKETQRIEATLIKFPFPMGALS